MDKKVEVFEREYGFVEDAAPGNMSVDRSIACEDNIGDYLEEKCVLLRDEWDINKVNGTEERVYSSFDKGRLCYITTDGRQHSTTEDYTKYVRVEVMPKTAEFPEDLLSALKERGFKKVK